MQKTLFFLCGLLSVPFIVQAQESWVVTSFDSVIAIEETGEVQVTETIAVDFKQNQKHGIIRSLPYVYTNDDGEPTYTRITDISVEQDELAAQTDITRSSDYIAIRIGDPDVVITGTHTYVIHYTAVGVLQSFEGFDELYWNVTGNEWDVPIVSTSAMVRLPVRVMQVACYAGEYGSSNSCQVLTTDDNVVSFNHSELVPGEGLTIAVGFEPGILPIIQVSRPLTFVDVLTARGTIALAAVISVLGVGGILRHWYRYGRDRHWQRRHLPGVRSDRGGQKPIEEVLPLLYRPVVSPEYKSPDGLRPAEVGVLMDERADTLDISATIVDLASRGFLEITEISKKWVLGKADYEFSRTSKLADDVMTYERTLLDRMFDGRTSVKMSDLKNSFYKDLRRVKQQLYDEVTQKKLFPTDPNKTRKIYLAVSVLMCVAGIGILALLAVWVQGTHELQIYHQMAGGLAIAIVVLGVFMIVMSRFMPRKTGYGRELYTRVLGYELFVSQTEKYRAKFLEEEGLFFEILPYAIVFGVTDKLAKAFKEMGIEPENPTWYHSTRPFQAAAFASDMNTFSSSLGTTMTSSPSSSGSGGGGFSGGGFGGGGGSSW